MKTKLLAVLLLGGSSVFAETHFSIGVGVGVPAGGYGHYEAAPPPPAPEEYVPACPAPGYTWVQGYWYPVGPRHYWHAGYWSRPPYGGGYRVSPGYYEHRYYPGYWERRERHWDRDDRERWEHHQRHRDHDRRRWDR